MMNKNIFSQLIMRSFNGVFPMSIGIILFFSSCDDLLKEEPRAVTEENFYNTAAEVETAVNAIYSPLRSENQTTYIATLECHTDYGYGRGSFAQYNDFQGMNSNNINRVAGFWNAFYLSIRVRRKLKSLPRRRNFCGRYPTFIWLEIGEISH